MNTAFRGCMHGFFVAYYLVGITTKGSASLCTFNVLLISRMFPVKLPEK